MTQPIDLTSLLPPVIAMAEAAGRRLAAEFARPDGPRGSGDRAEVDDEIEAALRERLLMLLPARWLGEETGAQAGPGGPWCWLVDPHDGTRAFLEGHRGSAVSVALLHEGLPVLGVVHAPLSPDCGADTIAWAEGLGHLVRNGTRVTPCLAKGTLSSGAIVFVSQAAAEWPIGNAQTVAPGRFVALPSIAYRLARVAAGDGVAAVSLNSPCGWDYAAGHALLRGAGGVLIDEAAREVTYTVDGRSSTRRCFGGAPAPARALAARDWGMVRNGGRQPHRVSLPWPRIPEGAGLDRAIGCLLGQVAGDSLGSLVEFRSERDIARQYPEGVRDLADGGTWNTIAGQPTDDSELALDLARTLVSQTSWSSEAVAAAYAGWYASRPFDIGGTTRQALSAAAATAQDKARAARKAANRESQANGALMRCAPIGIWARDAAEAAAAARQDAALTHPHPICQAASAAFVAAIATGIGGGDREAMLTSAEAAMPEPDASPLRAALARARAGEGPGDFMSQQGWVLIAFQNAFRHLAAGTSIEDALIETAGAGGDTDTNGAICGALLGAAQGSAAVPSRWSMAVLACRPAAELGALRPRPARYWPDDLQTLAEALMTRRLSSPPETHAQTERKATVILPSTAPGCGTEDTNRRCLRDPIPEIFEAARYLRCAVAKHMAGDHERAADLFRAANMSEIRQWTESIWGKQNPKILQFREVSGSPALLPPNLRAPSRMPSADVRKCLITRFGYNCAFCGIPLVRRHVRERIFRCYPDAVMWGTRNESQHAAFQAMWLQFDHVLPYARGGDNSAENLLITCSPCNYGRMNYTLKELGLADPRDRPANKTEWDGLEGFR